MRFIIIVMILSSFYCQGQGSWRGRVVDEENKAIPGAHILLTSTSQIVISNEAGNFKFNNLSAGVHEAQISFIGYRKIVFEVHIVDGQETFTETSLKSEDFQLANITVSATTSQPLNTLSQLDMKLRPLNTSQDILRLVPGLFIAQHAGGGKAEQIFMRGFDVDHGTDISLEVDDMPVNMVSHAHGQGYADLHFLIPELVNYVDFDKGPYFADKGNFNTAGYVSFYTKKKLERNFVKMEGGSFRSGRVVAGINIPLKTKRSYAYVATELARTDGFFESPQKFNRINFQARYSTDWSDRVNLTTGFSLFNSDWKASGQIPERAVSEGIISRFGSLDNTEGGNTGRINLFEKLSVRLKNGSTFESQVYVIKYNFNLFSNFTFFLNDPMHGDQIQQSEDRMVYGFNNRYYATGTLFGKELKSEAGTGLRLDRINNVTLAHTEKRVFLSNMRLGDVKEANVFSYWRSTLAISEKITATAAIRFDYLNFNYQNHLVDTQANSVSKSIINPKLEVNYQASTKLKLYLRSGTGFHSNDARVVIEKSGEDILPRAYGIDLGAEIKINSALFIHTALWRLDLDQEFVYVGDVGIVEPGGKTKREGFDLSARYQFNRWLFADVDLNISRPRAKGTDDGAHYIPLAPLATSMGGIVIRKQNGLNGSLRYRYLKDRPANETNSVIAEGYFIMDALLNYSKPGFEIGLVVENMLNRKWKEAQFNTESRLKDESEPVSEIHFTPGIPFSAKLKFVKYF